VNENLWTASKTFAPGFPRQCADASTIQARRDNRASFVQALDAASSNEMPGYYSVYSFPRGHSKEGNIPDVDCIFIDLDVNGDDYSPREGKTEFDAWKREMSALLARARMIAQAIIEAGAEQHFRVTLSGHKGLHLYLDFPTIDPANGEFGQFKAGLKRYGETVMAWLDDIAGGVNIDPWVDVDASDLGRLARHPNTRHHGAAYDDEARWCVPITMGELAALHWEDYLAYTSDPRPLPDEGQRVPSATAGNIVTQYIRNASPSERRHGQRSSFDPGAVKAYRDGVNEDIELEDVLFLTKNKPCFEAFRDREDAYDYGESSRAMELSIMGRLIEMNVPIDVMHAFFEPIPGYDEEFTQSLIEDLIGRGYAEFNCETICGTTETPGRAPQFCCGETCAVYRREDELQK